MLGIVGFDIVPLLITRGRLDSVWILCNWAVAILGEAASVTSAGIDWVQYEYACIERPKGV
jgi:hypothetical protein